MAPTSDTAFGALALPARKGGRVASVVSSLGAIAGAVLVPKCPLCVAALLSSFGVGAAAVSVVAPFVRPIAFALAALTLLTVVAFELRRSRRRARSQHPSSCCD